MGYRISWIAFLDSTPEVSLAAARLTDTGIGDQYNETAFSGAAIPGAYLLWADDFDYASLARLAALSVGRSLIGCQVHEGLMFSSARLFRDGRELWSVVHDAQQNLRHLDVSGDLPDPFRAILVDLTAQQDIEDAGEAEVDYFFEVPLLTAKLLCGFKHDEVPLDQAPVFTALQPLDTPAKAKPGWLPRLFG